MNNFIRKGYCTECEKKDTLIAKKIGGKRYCLWCNKERLKERKKPKKKTGEAEFFMQIWNSRPHVCDISGKKINIEPKSRMWYSCFSHILPKSSYPDLRLSPENISLQLPSIHKDYHEKTESELVSGKYGDKWKELFERKRRLKKSVYGS